MSKLDLKQQIITALEGWIAQRPGLEYANYRDPKSYRQEMRRITKHRHDAQALLLAVSNSGITGEELFAAFPRAYSGRLACAKRDDGSIKLHYCAGQYWPTEYRAAVCAVLAHALWQRARADMPAPSGKIKRMVGVGSFAHEGEYDSVDGLTAGEWMRRSFERRFGHRIASTWFD